MIQEILVLNSSFTGSRDLFWVDEVDPEVIGYNIYRSYNAPGEWVKLNAYPHPGHLYRDITSVELVEYVIQPTDWVSYGIDGQWVMKVPAPIWSSVVKGKALIANHPDDVTLKVNWEIVRAGRVDGQEGLVYMTNFAKLAKDGSVTTTSSNPLKGGVKGEIPTNLDVRVTYKKLTNYVDIFISGVKTFYTVVPVLEGGAEAHLVGEAGSAIANSYDTEQIDYIYEEMVRRNQWIFEQSGEPAYLMIRKTKGTICQCVISNGEPRTGCPSCYETGVVGGYYGPLDILFIDPDVSATRTLDEGGVKVERTSKSYLTRTPIVHSGDMIVRRNGERMVISNVVYKSPKGVILQQDFDVELLQPKDTRYLIPLGNNPLPALFDPRFTASDPTKEPVTNPETDPTKTWENPTKPAGRTVSFGNIMT
jgi:hypothetical protein